ncbi:MAG: tRNA pseudouridine synthase A [bacterium]|nr:tRNA pseudouridine synthase A [bacterium]
MTGPERLTKPADANDRVDSLSREREGESHSPPPFSQSYRLDLQYHGACFHGWQKQPNGLSVEEALRVAYERFLGSPVFVDGSGRTDAGVHARHQVALLKTPFRLPAEAVLKGVLPYLHPDISIFRTQEVSATWQPRPVEARQYRYFLWKGSPPPLFYRPFSAWTPYPLDIQRMAEAAALIPGERDFSSFRGAGCTARHPIRRVDRVVVLNRGGHWEFRVTGNAFLRQMVRILVGTLVQVGTGKIEPVGILEILAARDRRLAGPTMPPEGLFLWKITFPGETEFPIPPTCWEVPIG